LTESTKTTKENASLFIGINYSKGLPILLILVHTGGMESTNKYRSGRPLKRKAGKE
jgi:hypothetical protein